MTRLRRVVTASCVIVSVAAVPDRALAQKQELVAGLAEFVEAAGSEDGHRVFAALDRMSRGLAAWDRAIAQAEAHTRTAAGGGFLRHLTLAGLYIDRGRLNEALRELDAALRLESRRAELHLLHGSLLTAAGRHDEAARALHHAWMLAPGNAVHAYLVHRSTASAEDRERAATTLHAAYAAMAAGGTAATSPFVRVELLPDTSAATPVFLPARYADGLAFFRRADYGSAIARWRRAAPTEDRERDGIARAAAFVRSDRPAEAERILLDTIEHVPDSALARWQLAGVYEATQRIGEARGLVETIAEATVAGTGLAHDRAGRLARIEGDFAGALEAFSRAVAVRPNDAGAHAQLSRAYLEQDRASDAFAELVAAAALAPGDADVHAAIGRLALDAGRPDEAVIALRRALALAPDRHEARYALAAALQRAGNTAAAARELAAFEQAQRAETESRRRDIAIAVRDEEAALRRPAGGGSGQ